MSIVKIAIASDSHNNWKKLQKAIDLANKERCEQLLYAGDLTSAKGIEILSSFNGNVKLVWGNMDKIRKPIKQRVRAVKNVTLCGNSCDFEIDGLKIFMNHYPRKAEKEAKKGGYELCIHGHTHSYRNEEIGKTTILNPGALKPTQGDKPSFAIYNTKTKQVEKITI